MPAPVAELFNSIIQGTTSKALDETFPFYPLTAPGMPLPGPDFIAAAVAYGGVSEQVSEAGTGDDKRLLSHGPALHYLYRRALYDEQFSLNVNVKGTNRVAPIVPGHLAGDDTRELNGGPRRARIMVIGKCPGQEEIQCRKNLVGPTSQELWRALDELGVGEAERADWYLTNLCKWPQLAGAEGLSKAWVKDCALLLEQEIRLVRPEFILCLGSDASKHLLGTPFGVQSMVGRVMDYSRPIFDRGEESMYHNAKVMAVVHPAQVYRRPEMFDEFRSQLNSFLQLTRGVDIGGRERAVKHVNIYKARHLRQVIADLKAKMLARQEVDPLARLVAVDCEWHGKYPTEPNSYLRSIQFSAEQGTGYVVVLRYQGGEPAFKPGIDAALQILRDELFTPQPEIGYRPRFGGHAFRSDLPWLVYNGIDLLQQYAPAATPEECRYEGGWDTTLMYHAYHEAASYGLEDMSVRLTTAPRYDQPLDKWKHTYCKVNKIKIKSLEGYGDCPEWILHPEEYEEHPNYAGYDPDVTLRIAYACMRPGGLLDSDWFGESSWEPYWIAHGASLGFLEMEMSGLMLDRPRTDEIMTQFYNKHEEMLRAFRAAINWETFNPESSPQCVGFLFGDNFSKKRDKTTGAILSLIPQGAVTLGLTPVKTTGKRSKMWADVVSRNEQANFTPSTDKEVLGILGHAHPLAMQLRDLRFVKQVLKAVLKPPVQTEDGFVEDAEENYVYEDGLPSATFFDGRVHTHLSQLKETGRASSYRPALQNLSSRREDDYLRIFGESVHKHPIRSIFCARPGYLLVEADYQSAEMAVLAWLANDPVMTDHVQRAMLPESDPRHYEIHSRTAVAAFQLDCEPTKTGLKLAGKKSLRTAAKNVNFGIPYGRGALAIMRQCHEEGAMVTLAETERLMGVYHETYRNVEPFLQVCRERSQNPGWLATSNGRRRRFITSVDRSVIGEQERQAQNILIQGGVADTVSRAITNLTGYRREYPYLGYMMLLQIHDALLFEVPIAEVAHFVKVVLPETMCNRVPFWPRNPDNTPMTVERPYFFGIDTKIQRNWGESLSREELSLLGIAL